MSTTTDALIDAFVNVIADRVLDRVIERITPTIFDTDAFKAAFLDAACAHDFTSKDEVNELIEEGVGDAMKEHICEHHEDDEVEDTVRKQLSTLLLELSRQLR